MLQLSNWFRDNRDTFVRYANMLSIWTLITIMVAGGFGMGYVISQAQVRPMMAQHEARYNAEISRLQDVYSDTLTTMGYRTLAAAKVAQGAAITATEAVNEAKVATTASATAVKASAIAVKESKRTTVAAKPLESSRRSINHSIDKANEGIK